MNAPQHNYAVNRENAVAAGATLRIQTTGKYYGTLTRAEAVTSRKGTIGIDFSFKSDDGATADYLSVWTMNKDGKEIFGRKIVDAIMTCLRVKTMAPKVARIEKFNPDTRKPEPMEASIFPDLMNQPIGLLLQVEEYVNSNGERKLKMALAGCFEHATDKTAREIWGKLPAGELDAQVANLRDKMLPAGASTGAGGGYGASAAQSHSGARPASNFSDMDDDIPF